MRQPAMAVTDVPSLVGRLPTMTQPLRSTTKAVVRPTPPMHFGTSAAVTVAKTLVAPWGETCTIVLPVPCRLELALKLLTSTSFFTRLPIVRGTTAMPYGLMSPLAGTVDPITVCVGKVRRKGGPAAAAVADMRAAALRATTRAVATLELWLSLGMGRISLLLAGLSATGACRPTWPTTLVR